MSPSWKVCFERPGISSTYFRPSAERGRTESVVSTDSGSMFLSSFRSSTAIARSLPFDRLPRARDVLDDADAEAARAHLVALHELGAVRHLGLELVGRHERQAVVRLVRDEHGDDRDQHRHRADQDRARARAVGCRALIGRGGSRGRRRVVGLRRGASRRGGCGAAARRAPAPRRRRAARRGGDAAWLPRSDPASSRPAVSGRGTGCTGDLRLALGLTCVGRARGSRAMLSRSTWPMSSSAFVESVCQ